MTMSASACAIPSYPSCGCWAGASSRIAKSRRVRGAAVLAVRCAMPPPVDGGGRRRRRCDGRSPPGRCQEPQPGYGIAGSQTGSPCSGPPVKVTRLSRFRRDGRRRARRTPSSSGSRLGPRASCRLATRPEGCNSAPRASSARSCARRIRRGSRRLPCCSRETQSLYRRATTPRPHALRCWIADHRQRGMSAILVVCR